jgi:hypothetical protein
VGNSWGNEWAQPARGRTGCRKLVGVETRRWFEVADVGWYRAWMLSGRRTKLDLGSRKRLDHSHGSATERTSPEGEAASVVGNRLRGRHIDVVGAWVDTIAP